MSDPCSTCAFDDHGAGGAADEPHNALKGLICAHGAIPFWCHHAKDGSEYDWQMKDSKLGPFALPPNNRKLCGGWQAEVAKLARRGFFRNSDYRVIRRCVANVAWSTLDKFAANGVSKRDKKALRRKLERMLRFLVTRNIEHEEIPL